MAEALRWTSVAVSFSLSFFLSFFLSLFISSSLLIPFPVSHLLFRCVPVCFFLFPNVNIKSIRLQPRAIRTGPDCNLVKGNTNSRETNEESRRILNRSKPRLNLPEKNIPNSRNLVRIPEEFIWDPEDYAVGADTHPQHPISSSASSALRIARNPPTPDEQLH